MCSLMTLFNSVVTPPGTVKKKNVVMTHEKHHHSHRVEHLNKTIMKYFRQLVINVKTFSVI